MGSFNKAYSRGGLSPGLNSAELAAEPGRATGLALRLLSRRPRTEAELRWRLAERFTAEAVESAIGELAGRKLIDDAAFARDWRAQRERRHPKSAGAITRELEQLGVEQPVIEAAMAGFDAADNAYRAARKYARRQTNGDLAAFERRLWGFLQRRGFTGETNRQTIQRLKAELRLDAEQPDAIGGQDDETA